ncbi:MAG: sigma-54 dependent transcriptional regulator [Pseudomonadota bacterium]
MAAQHLDSQPQRILIVEDDDNLREALDASLSDDGYRTVAAADGEHALQALEANAIDLVISDVQMSPMDGNALLARIKQDAPEMPVVLMTAYGSIQKAVDAMHHGAIDYLVKPFAADTLVETVRRHMPLPQGQLTLDAPVAADPKSRTLLGLAKRVAKSDATVMIHGESGTGKEVYARYIHSQSDRADKPFVAINCAAIPESMLEAVLFGHEKGAFTGAATARAGKFEQAQGGTLLLDEISEMDLGLQAKLLRVLQEKEVERLGSTKTLSLDVRVLATTNRDLKQHVLAGRFREDLYYRLQVVPMALPALRERPGDIIPLAKHCLARCGGERHSLRSDAEARLLAYRWPGNVRELDNVVQRAVILSPHSELTALDFALEQLDPDAEITGAADVPRNLQSELSQKEDHLILSVLSEPGMTRKDAAARLGISPRTLRYKIAKIRDTGVTVPGVRQI